MRDDHGVALGVGQDRFLAGVDQPHRPPRGLDEQRQEDLDGDVFLAAEPAADDRALHADLVLRHAERLRDAPEMLDHLRRHAEVDHALAVEPPDARFRLDVGVVLVGHPEGVLDDQVGLGEAAFQVALADLPLADLVVRVMQDRRARLQPVFGIEDARRRLVLDLDQSQRRLGDRLGLGGDQRDRLADEADVVDRQHGRIRPLALRLAGLPRHVGDEPRIGQVARGEHADDARQGARLAHVEPDDARRRLGAAEDLGVQHPGHAEVAGVDGRADGLAQRIHPAQRLADDLQLRQV